MIYVSELNGFIYIDGLDEELDWCDHEENKNGQLRNYFLLNCVTKQYFKRDILPLIREGHVHITQELYDKIRLFVQNPSNVIEPVLNPITDEEYAHTIEGITLMPHQITALKLMIEHNKFAFFYGPGTGKTLIAISYLKRKRPSSCLIVTPQKVIGQYTEELDKYIPGHNYKVTNFEMLHHEVYLERSDKKRTSVVKALHTYDTLIIDESHRAKSYMSDTNIMLRELAKYAKNIYLFTGTPQDKNRNDILAQLAILDPRVMPVKSKTLERYFRIDNFYEPKNEIRERKHELTEVIKCYAVAEKTENVIELTNEHTHIIKCPHQSELYDELFKDNVLDPFPLDPNYECICDSPTILRITLKELCSGVINVTKINREENETPDKWFRISSVKTDALRNLLKDIPSCIIYYEFTESIHEIEEVIHELNKECVIVNGHISAKKSTDKINVFKNGDVDYLVIQSRSGNAGLDLSNVHDIIFYALPDSFIIFEQCKHRIRRKGQTEDCNYYYLISEDTVEEGIYNTLQKKKSFNDRVFTQLYQGERQWTKNLKQ